MILTSVECIRLWAAAQHQHFTPPWNLYLYAVLDISIMLPPLFLSSPSLTVTRYRKCQHRLPNKSVCSSTTIQPSRFWPPVASCYTAHTKARHTLLILSALFCQPKLIILSHSNLDQGKILELQWHSLKCVIVSYGKPLPLHEKKISIFHVRQELPNHQ